MKESSAAQRRRHRWPTLTARLALVVCACGVSGREALAQATPAGESTAVIRIVLRPYDDSDESLSEIDRLLLLNAPRRSTVTAGETISRVIAREYGFGARDLPRTYTLVEKTMLAWNRLDSPHAMRPGTLLIPDLPQKTRFNPAIATNRLPTASASAVGLGADTVGLKSTQTRKATRLGASGVEMYVNVPESLVARYANAGILSVDTPNTLPVHSLAINFSQGPCVPAGSPPILESTERTEITPFSLRTSRGGSNETVSSSTNTMIHTGPLSPPLATWTRTSSATQSSSPGARRPVQCMLPP